MTGRPRSGEGTARGLLGASRYWHGGTCTGWPFTPETSAAVDLRIYAALKCHVQQDEEHDGRHDAQVHQHDPDLKAIRPRSPADTTPR